jgi:hypothetical protein
MHGQRASANESLTGVKMGANKCDHCGGVLVGGWCCLTCTPPAADTRPVVRGTTWYVAVSAGGAYVESSLDLDRLCRIVRDEVLSPDDGTQDDVIITDGHHVRALILADGRVIQIAPGGVSVTALRYTDPTRIA